MIYSVKDKTTGAEVSRYCAVSATEETGYSFSTHDHVEFVEGALPTTKFGGRRILTKLEFRSLFAEAALKAIDRFEVQFEQSAVLTDDQKDTVRTAFNDYREAQGVNLDDPRWIPGLGLYVTLGIMTADEVSGVLGG